MQSVVLIVLAVVLLTVTAGSNIAFCVYVESDWWIIEILYLKKINGFWVIDIWS